ncbi:hypothetical protein PGT21_017482 [Puccinia graminis f. sp. tritici]|uniref:Uncharacterized protein n=1 Tax=Puccinia graminis f. sp. tritici TaxID=56615 RepID=A0A5B0P3U1_PUCGR|nr:hypothetical protein PGTUg99_025571 [Puccinia graminis f. sp. tritici]KAA1099702.1 hypothetical protein PGT21_017482 [Puccinia graminis f. sp. tritici]
MQFLPYRYYCAPQIKSILLSELNLQFHTGCINVNSCDRLKADDGGGQYDSHGGDRGLGNPPYSFCKNYHTYVQLIEPSANRACLRCCANPSDCDLSKDTQGCPAAIPGKYFTCG